MNQNYEKYILQKYIVAIAFAIIKSKPIGQPLEEYVNVVRYKFDRREDLFQDVSISDSDFGNCDDEINDVNNVLETGETLAIVAETNVSGKLFDDLVNNFDRDDQTDSNHINDFFKPMDGVTSNVVESISVLKDVNSTRENSCQQLAKSTSIKEILDIFKDIDKINKNKIFNSTSTPKKAQTQITPGSGCTVTKVPTVDDETTYCSFEDKDETDKIDTQNTELYTVHGNTDNFTHISQSQDINIVVPKKLIRKSNSINNTDGSSINEKFEYVSNKHRASDNVYTNRNNISITNDTLYTIDNTVEEYNIVELNNLDTLYTNRVVDDKSKKIKLSNNSVTKSSDEYSHLFTHMLSDGNSKKYSGSPNATENLTGIFNKSTFSSTSLLNELELDSNSLIGCNKPREHSLEHKNDNDVRAIINIENNFNPSDNHFIFSTDSETQYYARNNNAQGNDLNANSGPTVDKNTCKYGQLSSGYETQCASRNLVLDSPNEIEERSDADAPEDIVTFKILEELNRVKNYLNRQDRFSDSVRSSQGSQLSGARINESGFCLLNYLVEYPLIERTLDITEEVSRVLGELVDKLHDDETYPQFVQKILEKAQELIKDIYEEDRTDDLVHFLRMLRVRDETRVEFCNLHGGVGLCTILLTLLLVWWWCMHDLASECTHKQSGRRELKKEDQMNRLLLLNRSLNVTKFTIEKIQPILQEVHLQLQKKDFLELCLVKSENLCYVLHTLEVLLKRYNAAASSQASTQLSQDDEKSLKRSTITEIWRKKWNLSKVDVSEGSFKKRCVLTQTSEVLNKIIVEGMDGYSLISFAALQCFNLLQL